MRPGNFLDSFSHELNIGGDDDDFNNDGDCNDDDFYNDGDCNDGDFNNDSDCNDGDSNNDGFVDSAAATTAISPASVVVD